ncbi:zinc finger protein 516-like [Pholidichthys leucotaenia]
MGTDEKEDVPQKPTADMKMETEEDASSAHTCGVCGRSFPLLSSLSQHMRRHTQEKPYKCPYCEHRTAQKGSLKAHIRSHKLGLFTLNHSDKEGDGDQGQKDDADVQDNPKILSPSDKAHNINGKVKKKTTKKKVKGKCGLKLGNRAEDDSFSCTICGQVFPQVLHLKSHMKRQHNSQDHGCQICGRRFRQAWFLQSHMRIHQVKAQALGGKNSEFPTTINGVSQDPASLINEDCLYELCASCGNFFSDRKALRIHKKLHELNHCHNPNGNMPHEDLKASDVHISKRRFLECLNLTCVAPKETSEKENVGRRIPELDPVCSYQAWQLATRGRLAETTEKCLGWEERLADAAVAYDTEKGEYVSLKQEKKRKQIDSSSSNLKKKKSDDHRGGNKKICQKDRILLNGLGHAFYEALQSKKDKDAKYSSKQMKNTKSQDKEGKGTYFCEHCDFRTADAALLRSHIHVQHQDFLAPYSKQNISLDINRSGSKSSRYMDYLRSRSMLLSQPYWSPYTCPPSQDFAETNIKIEKSNGADIKVQESSPGDAGSLLNLSSLPITDVNYSVKTEGLVRHHCPYCSHTTSYPEVLWIHQRVAHRVDSSSALAPKWAPSINNFKSLKAGGSKWRRTGPPPFLEGKDCPALPAPRTQRTQPPDYTTHSSSSSNKHTTHKTHSGIPKHKHQSKDSRASDGIQSGGKVGHHPQKKEHGRAGEGGSKFTSAQATSSNSTVHSKSLPSFQPKSSPTHRAAVEGNFPQEGLGFMLARNHGGTSSNAVGDRLHSRRQSSDFSSSPKGPDLWAAMNMWGLHGSKAFLDPLLFSQGKSDSAEMPVDIDILGLLKNYSPHDLAALYQHWGFIDPRLDPQAMLQFNGNFGNEVHSSSEASKQISSRSTPSSGSLHKGT